jgi:hypothetical protein
VIIDISESDNDREVKKILKDVADLSSAVKLIMSALNIINPGDSKKQFTAISAIEALAQKKIEKLHRRGERNGLKARGRGSVDSGRPAGEK